VLLVVLLARDEVDYSGGSGKGNQELQKACCEAWEGQGHGSGKGVAGNLPKQEFQ
jgi:hypothetical protein